MTTQDQRYLIAGCGYVGSELAQVLAQTHAGVVYALRRSAVAPAAYAGISWLVGDLVHEGGAALPRDLDAVFYTAAPDGSTIEAYAAVYQRGLSRILNHLERTGRPGARLVLTSSTSVYGQSAGEWVDEDAVTAPTSATSKLILAGEALLRPQDIAVRLAGIYGPGRTSLIEGVRQGTMTFNPQGSAYTNRIHQADAARILAHVAALAAPARIYNGVDSVSATRFEVGTWLAEQLGTTLLLTTGAGASSTLRGHKRCSNQRLVASGYRFLYPSYRDGYSALMPGGSSVPPSALSQKV